MDVLNADTWNLLSETYGFIGNSLLKPMNQTATTGLDSNFWESFPRAVDNELVEQGLSKLVAYATEASVLDEAKAIENASVEFTHLFIGPPSPAAPPWETMNRAEDVTIGFGRATHEMREKLREAGLELSNENHQYEDHIGIELLYLSAMCSRFASDEPSEEQVSALNDFISERPLSWIANLRQKVEADTPNGYIDGLVTLAEGILVGNVQLLK